MIRFEKRTITCDVGIAKCENGTAKREKTVKEPPNLEKKWSHMMLELHNVRHNCQM